MSVGRSPVCKKVRSRANHIQIVGVGDVRDVPSIRGEACATSSEKSQRRTALDRDPVAVVNPAEIRKFQVGGERGGFARNSLHHAAIAAQRVHIEIVEVFEARLDYIVMRAIGRRAPSRRCSRSPDRAAPSWFPLPVVR